MRLPVATLAVVLLLAACVENELAPPPAGPAPEPSPQVEPPSPTPIEGQATISFEPETARAVSSVREVHVDLVVSGVPGQGKLDVEFIAPGFMAYEKRSTVLKAQPSERRSVRFTLPVAGTTVTSSRLEGTWEARFFLDGAPLTVAPFTLEP
jgi:hypothetical protein